LEAYASDLNPVAVLINKAMIEIPPKFAGMPPVNPESRNKKELIKRQWKGAEGLAEDVRYYGQWMRDEAEKRIGHLYPKVKITSEMVAERPDLSPYEGQELTAIAWLWARTVKSPNPAFSHVDVPLASTFMLSTKAGKDAYVQPVIENCDYRFKVEVGKPKDFTATKDGTKFSRGNFRCVMSGNPIDPDHIKSEAKAGRMQARLMAIVAEGKRGRVYLTPTQEQEHIARQAKPEWKPDVEFFQKALGFRVGNYGMTRWSDLFTDRQLVALSTLCSLVGEAQEQIQRDALQVGLDEDNVHLRDGGAGAAAYAEAVAVYLGMAIDRSANTLCTIARWTPERGQTVTVFARQAIPMTWDFPDVNPFSGAAGDYGTSIEGVAKGMTGSTGSFGHSSQADASSQSISTNKIVSTDPPYYDNIGYADLSDFFYVWMRRSLRPIFPELFATLAVPKAEELVATPARHGGKTEAEEFFLDGMTRAMHRLATQAHVGFPATIYYAFKQSETVGGEGTASTGWQTFLSAVLEAGLAISGTWPMRTELANRMRGMDSNALATSMVLVCQRRDKDAAILSRNQFRRDLRQQLPQAIKELEQANIAPVDVPQAAIGPGMAIYSQAKAVLNPDDSPMSVREALIEINSALDEHFSQNEGAFDADTRFALTFFESYGYSERLYGDAESLAIARNISVEGVARAGILSAIAGKVQLLRREQLDDDWDPSRDDRLCIWEATQHLIKALEGCGEAAAAALMVQLKQLPGQSDLLANCRALAYRLYNHCEKTKQAEEGRAYNGLVIAWQEIERQASNQPTETAVQASLI
jgi:putative DNA methylase